MANNRVQEARESQLLSKSELARKAGVSTLTIDRVEKGHDCRMETKRKILLALGVDISERKKIFLEDTEESQSPLREKIYEQKKIYDKKKNLIEKLQQKS